MKRFLLFIALLISVLGLNAQSAIIDYGTYSLDFEITSTNPAECSLIGYSKMEVMSLTIPSTVVLDGNEYTVTSIGESAFEDCYVLTSIEIPNSVTSIGDYAFEGCFSLTSIVVDEDNTVYDSRNNCNAIIETASNTLIVGCMNTAIPNSVTSIGESAFEECESLTSIAIPNSVTSIGDDAFSRCSSLTSIAIPNSVTSIGDWAFYYCSSLTSIEIPNSVTSIGDDAFSRCSSLTSIEIPNSVTFIGESAFEECLSLTSIVVDEDNTVYDSRNNCNAIIETASNTLIVGCMNTAIPNSVTSIGDDAFSRCSSLTSIEIPNSVTSIGDWAFMDCSSLTSIEIPNSVTSIGDRAFMDCSSLTSIEIPNSVTSIGYDAFWGCSSLTSIAIPNSVTSIEDGAFCYCFSLTSIAIPNSVTSIEYGAFSWCESLTSVFCFAEDVPATVEDVFYGCPDNMVIYVPKNSVNAYESTSPWNLYTILDMSAYCNVTVAVNTNKAGVVTGAGPYEINDNVTVTAIANEGCTFLNWTEDGEVVSEDAEYSFVITGNRNLVANFDVPILQYIVTNNSPAECEVDGFFDKEYTSLTIPSTVVLDGNEYTVTSIGDRAFEECESLTSIDIPNSVISIGDRAFYYCSSLTSIAIPNSVTSIGVSAFYHCSSLTSIAIPNSVTSIGESAFTGCSSLTSIAIPNSVTSIEDEAFWCCSSLTSIEIPNSVTSIGDDAFGGCSSLTSIEIPNSVTSIGDWAFEGCSSLTSIEIPNSVIFIGDRAFMHCSSLTSIEIPNSVISIWESAFWNCSSLTSIVVDEDNTVYDSRNNCNAIIETASNTLIVGCMNTAIPNSVTSIGGEGAFWGCSSLTSIDIPNSVTSIGDDAFRGCSSLTSIEIPNSVTSIEDGAFSWCSSLASIEIPNSVTSIGQSAFRECESLTSISIPNSVTSIGDVAFCYCLSLTSIEIPNSVTSIGESAFEGCSSLTSIEIPNSVTSIGDFAFSRCSSLTSVFCFAEDVPATGEYVFYGCPYNMVIYVPKNSVNAYESTSPWNLYTIIGIDPIVTYNVTAIASPEEAGIITGDGNYNHGEEVILTVTPNEPYKFVNWTENGEVVSEDAEYSFEVTNDRNLVANFELLSYNVTASLNPENAGVVTGAGTYNHGEEVILTVTPNEPYKFVNWTENGEVVSEESQYSFVIENDRNLVANFIQISVVYNIATTVNPENVGVVIGSGVYNEGDNVILTAIPIKNGYEFVNWTENGEVVSEEAQYSFVVESDRNLVANFEKEVSYNVILLTLDLNAGNVLGSGSYLEGETVTVVATPNAGYEFVGWTEDGVVVSEEAEYTFTITKDRVLVANFIQTSVVYNITTTVNPENVGVVIGSGVYYEGDNVILTAIPIKNGYEFVNWTEDGKLVSEDAQYSFVATSDRELVANFVLLEYYVTAALSSAEAGEITGDGNYNHGEEVTLTATAHEGYKFVNWTENGVVVSEDAEYSFVILKNRNLVANFSSEDIALNVVATAIDDNTIKVEWNAVESAESYNVYRASLTRNSEYEFIANVKETSFTDTELDANTKYFYSVTAVYADGSESEKSESAEATTKPESIEELSLAFNIYPNPVSDKLYIETEVEVEEVSIFDIYGRLQELSAVSCQPSAIDVSNLNSGVYFVKVVTENGEVVKRFVKK